MVSLRESIQYCRDITRERAKNFFYGIRLLPTERQDALCAVYAFFRYSDDVSDDEAIRDRGQLLEEWRAAVDPDGPGGASPILPAFHDAVRRYQIPHRYFFELIDGTQSDLTVTRVANFDELYRYCYQVASTVGLVCVHIFGFDGSAEALLQAEHRGIAFQLTNILRDIKEDAERDRVYLPADELERFGITVDNLLRLEPGPGFADFMQFQIQRARQYYERSEALVERVEPCSRASLVALTRIYRGVLEKVAEMGPGVLQKRAQLTKMEKLKLAGKGLVQGLKA